MTPPNIPPVMRSGIGGGEPSIDANSILETSFGRRLITTAACLIDSAAVTAAKYAAHARRQDVLPRDVHLALMYESMHFLHKESLERDVEIMEQELFGQDDEDDEMTTDSSGASSSSSSSTMSEVTSSAPPPCSQLTQLPEWTRSGCLCELCAAVHQCETSWDQWHPDDEAEKYLKMTVQNTIDHT
jgi:hypothetical protein